MLRLARSEPQAIYIHPNVVMIVLTSAISILLKIFANKEIDLLDKTALPYLRYLLPGLIISDSISVYKDSLLNKKRTLLW